MFEEVRGVLCGRWDQGPVTGYDAPDDNAYVERVIIRLEISHNMRALAEQSVLRARNGSRNARTFSRSQGMLPEGDSLAAFMPYTGWRGHVTVDELDGSQEKRECAV